MPWRHSDTDLHDDFPTHYNASDAARLSEVLVPLRPPPRHLMYVCGLTTACRHLELRYDIKYQHNNAIDMDTFLKLPSWTGTVVSRGDPIPDDQRPKPKVTLPLEAGAKIPDLTAFQKNLEKPNSKIAAARERKDKQHLAKAEAKGSDGTLSVTPLHQAEPEVVREPTPPVDATVAGSHVEKEVVDLSGDTRLPTPLAATTQPSADTEPPTSLKPATSEGHSSQSSHPGHEDEQVNNRYVPNWGLRNDLRVCTFRVCRELLAVVEGKIKGLENEKLALSAKVAQAEADRQSIVQEFIPTVVKRLHTNVEYRQSLAASVSMCFTAGWLGGLSLGRSEDEIKISDSYNLPIDELLKVSPDVPSATDKGNTSGVGTGEASQHLPPSTL
ncbi:hypothetical protein Tco_0270360 [Tanacetum coccineum]